MSDSYRIIKLKSGEDLITKIKGREKGKLIVETPMIFKSNIITDFGGIPKEVTILQKWSKYSTNKEVKIPEDYIISYFTPIDEAIRLYNLEKNKEEKESKISKQLPPMNNDVIKKMLDDLVDFKSNHEPYEGVFKFIGSEKDMEEFLDKLEMNLDDEFYNEEMYIPFEEINEDMYTGDDVHHPDYGNRWTDWDSDLTDFLEED